MAKIKTNSPQDEVSLDNINPYFEIYLDTFLYNAGIIGFIDVLKNCGAEEGKNINDKKDYFIDGQTLHVSKEFLLNPNTDLAQGYIDTVFEKFKKETFSEKLKNEKNKEDVIAEIVKHCEKNKGKYSIAFDIIDSFNGGCHKKHIVSDTEKTLVKILEDKEIIDIIDFYSLFKYFSIFIGNFAFLDSVNISLAVKRGETVSLKNLFSKFFCEPIKALSVNITISEKCFLCGVDMNKESGYKTKNAYKRHSLTFMDGVGLNIYGKASAYWNFEADIFVCPLCAFIYVCAIIGFIEINNGFVFVNDNANINSLIQMKTFIETKYKEEENGRSILNIAIEKMLEIKNKEIDSIQVVVKNMRLNRYNINVIDKNVIAIVKTVSDDLKKLASIFRNVNNIKINVFDECINNILNGVNQYNLIFILLQSDINVYDLFRLLKIQIVQKNIFREDSNMRDKMSKVYVACEEGNKIKNILEENKISSLVYRLTNALHTANKDLFLDTVTRIYNGMSLDMPSIFIQMFPSDDDFKELGYAYVLGLKGAFYNKKESKGEIDGK